MPKPRFQLIRVVHRGYPIAHIRDTRGGRDVWVYFKGGRYLRWDRLDDPVANDSLRRVAARALNPKLRPTPTKQIFFPERDCVKCGERFRPTGPTAEVCPSCRSGISRKNALAQNRQLTLEGAGA